MYNYQTDLFVIGNGIWPSKGPIKTYAVYNRRDSRWCLLVEDEADMAGVITLAEKRAEIKAVIVKRDLASADGRVLAIRRGHCHDLYNDEDEGEGSHGRRTLRVSSDTLSIPNWCACGPPSLHVAHAWHILLVEVQLVIFLQRQLASGCPVWVQSPCP
jgi:hypothetical protein